MGFVERFQDVFSKKVGYFSEKRECIILSLISNEAIGNML